jgi:hypothetical protein
MLSRALILATVALLIVDFSASAPVQAQNLEAGKSPSQIFAGSCTACHKGARGLLRTVPAGSLPGFLRQHYTTSPEMAGLLSAYLISNGAADKRYGGGQPKPDKAGKPDQVDRQGRRLRGATSQEDARPGTESQQAAKPDEDGSRPARRGRNGKRLVRPTEPAEGEAATSERDARKSTGRHRLGRRGSPGADEPSRESSKGDLLLDKKPAAESTKEEGGKPAAEGAPEVAKPETAKSEAVKSDAPKEATGNSQSPVLRADPVSPATPAPAISNAPATASGAQEPAAGGPTTSAIPSASQPAEAAHARPADAAPLSTPGSPVQSTPK